jgi:hypothetical protein
MSYRTPDEPDDDLDSDSEDEEEEEEEDWEDEEQLGREVEEEDQQRLPVLASRRLGLRVQVNVDYRAQL